MIEMESKLSEEFEKAVGIDHSCMLSLGMMAVVIDVIGMRQRSLMPKMFIDGLLLIGEIIS